MFLYCHRYDNNGSSKQQSKWCSKACRRFDAMCRRTNQHYKTEIENDYGTGWSSLEYTSSACCWLELPVAAASAINFLLMRNRQDHFLFQWKLKKPNCNNFMLRTWDVSELSWKEANKPHSHSTTKVGQVSGNYKISDESRTLQDSQRNSLDSVSSSISIHNSHRWDRSSDLLTLFAKR